MIRDLINYSRIALAQQAYEEKGYRNVATPWLVSRNAIFATLPTEARCLETELGCPVGSGEQGFMEVMLRPGIMSGKYQTTTPCFRDERVVDELHHRWFMKTELIWVRPHFGLKLALEEVVSDALWTLKKLSGLKLQIVPTSLGFDINYENIELGSYGIRKIRNEPDTHWIYGTGLAEPRMSVAINKFKFPREEVALPGEQSVEEVLLKRSL